MNNAPGGTINARLLVGLAGINSNAISNELKEPIRKLAGSFVLNCNVDCVDTDKQLINNEKERG